MHRGMAFDLPADAQQVKHFGLVEVLAAVRVEAVADLARGLVDGSDGHSLQPTILEPPAARMTSRRASWIDSWESACCMARPFVGLYVAVRKIRTAFVQAVIYRFFVPFGSV